MTGRSALRRNRKSHWDTSTKRTKCIDPALISMTSRGKNPLVIIRRSEKCALPQTHYFNNSPGLYPTIENSLSASGSSPYKQQKLTSRVDRFDPAWLAEGKYSPWLYKTDLC
ncbi:hypothetical protein XENOCAPTIV_013423 [Xenoophorus captivus]|uniref:Uncharacterized protein n=1 Tax=Xenoophorus captivus TaxID=1517983 RepID=A0ABV0R8X5_9TELE